MKVLRVLDVNNALPKGLCYLRDAGTLEQTRNGPAIVAPGPVATVYDYPHCCVLFDPERDANPFFHLFESLWILQGRDDVAFLAMFNKRMADYSDNGSTFNAPYGHRLRCAQGFDQVEHAIKMLKENPSTRQCVLQIWEPILDMYNPMHGFPTKDIPCNDMIMLDVSYEKETGTRLNMMVCNRSNDVIWGAYGANAVQFSMLQKYIASAIGVSGVGQYTQVSRNYHAYTDNAYYKKWMEQNGQGNYPPSMDTDFYAENHAVAQHSLFEPHQKEAFDADMATFFNTFDEHGENLCMFQQPYSTAFFNNTVIPMLFAWKNRNTSYLTDPNLDWHIAGRAWIERRNSKKEAQ